MKTASSWQNMKLVSALLCVAAAVSLPAHGKVGEAIFVIGEVTIDRAGSRPLLRGDALEVQDKISTGAKGRAQLRMLDNSKIALRPETVFLVERHQLAVAGEAGQLSAVSTREVKESAVYQLLKGGMRTITGDIGGKNNDAYQLKTPVATLGIRGTAYSAVLADPGACIKSGGKPAGSAVALYVTVSKGSVYFQNDAGRINIEANEFGCVTGLNQGPLLQLRPPAIMAAESEALAGSEEEEEVVADETDAMGDKDGKMSVQRGAGGVASGPKPKSDTDPEEQAEAESDPEPDAKPQESLPPAVPPASREPATVVAAGPESPPITPDTTFAPAGSTSGRFVALAVPQSASGPVATAGRYSEGSVVLDAAGNLTRISGPPGSDYAIGNARNVNTGGNPDSQIRWGRWADGVAQERGEPLDLSETSLHWVVGPSSNTQPVIPTTGSRSYRLVGNTDPTDNRGNVGVLGNATLNANFANSSVNSSVGIAIGGEVWNATGGVGDLNGSVFAGQYGSVTVDQAGGGTGSYNGFLTNNANGAGLTYSLENGNTAVSGSATFIP